MTENKPLEIGEKYLSIQILGGLNVACFKNKNKTEDKHPDYKGDGIAIWIREKKAPEQKPIEEKVL